MGNTYRMSKEEAEKNLVEYVVGLMSKTYLDTTGWDESKKASYHASISRYWNEDSTTKDKLKDAGNILKKNVQNWADFSLAVDSDPKEIIMRILLDYYYCEDPSATVCISYLGSNELLDEQFVKETIYLTSGFFRYEEWDDEHVNLMTKAALCTDLSEITKLLKTLYTDKRIEEVFGKGKNRKNRLIPIIFPINSSTIKYSKEFSELYAKYARYNNPETETLEN